MEMRQGENELWGRYAEWVARLVFSLEQDRGSHHDARDTDGRPVEVKACIRTAGQRGDAGKFFIRRANHRKLREAGGLYVFVLYDPENWKQGPVLKVKMKPAGWLDGVQRYAWTGNGTRRGEIVKRPPWTAVFPASEGGSAPA